MRLHSDEVENVELRCRNLGFADTADQFDGNIGLGYLEDGG
jgi:hypothetical protein